MSEQSQHDARVSVARRDLTRYAQVCIRNSERRGFTLESERAELARLKAVLQREVSHG